MPTYEYRCKDCGEHIEVVQSFSDDALTTCGLCKGELKKVFHPVGIVFKGSGFYVNDSKGSKATSSTTAGEKSSDSETKSETKSGESGDKGGKSEKKSSDGASDKSSDTKSSKSGEAKSA